MAKYDNVFNSEDTLEETLSSEEAVAAIAVITALADSPASSVDGETVASMLWDFELYDEYSEDEMIEMVARLVGIAKEAGLGALFNTAYDSLDDELMYDAFAAGVMILIDEEELDIPAQKKGFLKKLQSALELDAEEAQEVIDDVILSFEESEDEDEFDEEYEEDGVITSLYESPEGYFTVPIPVEPQKGGRVQTEEYSVAFSDDFGSLFRIDYYPFSEEEADRMQSMGKETYLQSWVLDNYVIRAIAAALPDARVLHSEYIEEAMDGAFFAVVDMPQGSTISVQQDSQDSVRLNAYRGLVAFIMDDFLYLVSSQHSFYEDETPDSIEREAEALEDKILDFIDTIEFIEAEE